MPELKHVEETTRKGEKGLKLTYEASGLTVLSVSGRLTGRLASKFPLKANKIERITYEIIDETGAVTEYKIHMFVPYSGIEDNRGVDALKGLVKGL